MEFDIRNLLCSQPGRLAISTAAGASAGAIGVGLGAIAAPFTLGTSSVILPPLLSTQASAHSFNFATKACGKGAGVGEILLAASIGGAAGIAAKRMLALVLPSLEPSVISSAAGQTIFVTLENRLDGTRIEVSPEGITRMKHLIASTEEALKGIFVSAMRLLSLKAEIGLEIFRPLRSALLDHLTNHHNFLVANRANNEFVVSELLPPIQKLDAEVHTLLRTRNSQLSEAVLKELNEIARATSTFLAAFEDIVREGFKDLK